MSVLWKKERERGRWGEKYHAGERACNPKLWLHKQAEMTAHVAGEEEANWQQANRACWAPMAWGAPLSPEAPARRQASLQTWHGALGILKEHLYTTKSVKRYYCLIALEMGRLRPKGLKPLAPSQQLEEGSQARLLGH